MTGLNQTCLVSDSTSEDLNAWFSNDNCCLTNNSSDFDYTEWYNEININSISLVWYYEPLSMHDEVYNEVEVFNLLEEVTVQHKYL